tara:strand:+ start:568 stop:1674 length:1107 start_codon:yes stop_codon:yes gene_type:complete
MYYQSYIYVIVLILIFQQSFADAYNTKKRKLINQNEIEWILDRQKIQNFRGGTTKGLKPEIDLNKSVYFKRLINTKDKKEKDRFAILSLTGEFKSSFEFTEIYGSDSKYELDNPYKSWGTEIVFPVVDEENFISLQHIIMMYFIDEKNSKTTSHVVKHWRQDWKYEDREILTYKTKQKWKNIKEKNIRGTWSQSVFQVDDTPRYESYGKWIHRDGASKWISKITSRPLPRREFSVRSDYEMLLGINKISVMSWGWVMEEINDKLKQPNKFIGSEYGLARYQRIKNYDFKPALDYWNDTEDYWKIVREKWLSIINENEKICLQKSVKGKASYMYYFSKAENFKKEKNIEESKKEITSITQNFLIQNCDI